jgi:hypothetical protein
VVDFAKVATEVLQVLRTYDYTVLLYDDKGMRVNEPEEARQFFDPKKNLMVMIKDDDDNSSIELSYGKSTHANDILGLNQGLKILATKSALLHSDNQFGKRRIEPKDVTTLGSITERQHKMILSLTEGMYGTALSSYVRLENARMIVRHSRRINDNMIGGRGRFVESIFIENASGERLLFPSPHLAPARAMTQHVNQGGTYTDPVGGQIMQMTNEFANLAKASSFVANNAVSLSEGAMTVREACRGKMRKFRKTFERLSRSSSYANESTRVLEHAKTLTETGDDLDESRISEIRQLLNDADLPKEVYECASKAMKEMKESEPMIEAEDQGMKGMPKSVMWQNSYDPAAKSEDIAVSDDAPKAKAETKKKEKEPAPAPPKANDKDDYVPKPGTTVDVLGYRVDNTAWERLIKQNKLFVTRPPEKENLQFPDRFVEICFRLGKWVPVVADVTLANLLGHIVDKMSIYQETGEIPEVGISLHRDSPNTSKQQEWKQTLKLMLEIALTALRARKIKAQPDKPTKKQEGMGIPAVAEHFSWFDRFNPDMILSEDIGLGDWGDPIGDGYGDVKNDIATNFDAHDFATSPELNEVTGEKDHQNPEENHLEHDEVMSALRAYIQRQIQMQSAEDSFSLYMGDVADDEDIADTVYDEACEALQHEGWIVQSISSVDEVDEADDFDDLEMDDLDWPHDDDDHFHHDDDMKRAISHDDDWLSMEDILLPTHDQGDSLVRQTSKAMVHDPDTDHEEKPNSGYISRLMTLAGVQNGGQNGQSY